MKRRAVFSSLVLLGAACAGGRASDSTRFFQRPELAQLSLQTLEVVVVTTNPQVAGPRLEFQTFNPPQVDQTVLIDSNNTTMSAALKLSLTKYLETAGYTVVGRGAPAPDARPTPTPVKASTTAIGLAETSSSGVALTPLAANTSTPSMTPTANKTVKPAVDQFSSSTKLEDILASSRADAVLVVRAVTVDAFQVVRENQVMILNPNDPSQQGAGQAGAREVFPRAGRLLFGQAFLFDKQTGLRLWSRQLPDFPTTNELTERHPQLSYGYVRGPNEAALGEPAKAARAAKRFTPVMLKDFPEAQTGSALAREQLQQVDVGAEQRMQRRLDKSTVSFEMGVGWGYETAGSRVRLDSRVADDFIDLSQNAVAPSGVIRFTPRIAYESPNGYRLHLGVPIGLAPNNFGRTYHRDSSSTPGSPRGVGLPAQIGRTLAIGAEAGIAFPFYLNPETSWSPEASLFVDNWGLKTQTPVTVSPNRQLRLGVLLGLSFTRRFGQTSPFFGRVAARTRLGFNASRSKGLVGFDLTAGAGFSF